MNITTMATHREGNYAIISAPSSFQLDADGVQVPVITQVDIIFKIIYCLKFKTAFPMFTCIIRLEFLVKL